MKYFAAILFFSVLSVILVGCGSTEKQEANTNAYLFEDTQKNLKIVETQGWTIEKEATKSVKLKNGNLVAIVTMIPKETTTDEIKVELKKGAGKVTIIEESENFFSWKSDRKESIRTEVYIEENEESKFVITFLTPLNTYEDMKKDIEALKTNIITKE